MTLKTKKYTQDISNLSWRLNNLISKLIVGLSQQSVQFLLQQ
jgi:hypothetical protein